MHHPSRFFMGLLASAFVVTTASEASARSFRTKDIPNGKNYNCVSCHGPNSTSTYTSFGNDARTHLAGSGSTSSKHENWATLCPLDSDGDGFTNGQELGDPNCTWTLGAANPGGATTNPGDPSSKPVAPVSTCGNGVLDSGEQCDGTVLKSSTCAAINAGTGSLKCQANCHYDTSGCSTPPPPDTNGTGSPSTGSAGGADGSGGASADDAIDGVPPVLPGACTVGTTHSSEDGTLLFVGAAALGLGSVLRRRRR